MSTAVDTAEQIYGQGRATGFGRREWAGRDLRFKSRVDAFLGAIRRVTGVSANV